MKKLIILLRISAVSMLLIAILIWLGIMSMDKYSQIMVCMLLGYIGLIVNIESKTTISEDDYGFHICDSCECVWEPTYDHKYCPGCGLKIDDNR